MKKIFDGRCVMISGFDTTSNCANSVQAIKTAGYVFVGRYLSQSSWKVITQTEASALHKGELGILLAYEDGPTSASYFVKTRGTADAQRAIQQAHALGAPAGVPIYFTVDFDATNADIQGCITEYFQEVNATFNNPGTGNPAYKCGVYGSGNTCSSMIEEKLAVFSWQAQSTGWGGYNPKGPWSIIQGPETNACGMQVDTDTAQPGNCYWRP